MAANIALNGSMDGLVPRCASVRTHVESGRVTARCIMVGMKISTTMPGSVPVNFFSLTPMI